MVTTQQYAPGGGAAIPNYDNEDPFAFINGGNGGKSVTFNTQDQYGNNIAWPIGSSYTGVVAGNPKVTAVLDFDTKEPATYRDGNPKKQIRIPLEQVLVLRPDLGNQWQDVRVLNDEQDDDDEGKRTLYAKDQMKSALADGLKAIGVGNFGVGTRITVTLIDMKPPASGRGFPQKIYQVTVSEHQPFVPDEVLNANQEMQGALQGGAPAQPVIPTQWAQQAPVDPSQGVQQQAVVPPQPNPAPPVPPQPQALPNTGAQLPIPAAPQLPLQAHPAVPTLQQQGIPVTPPAVPPVTATSPGVDMRGAPAQITGAQIEEAVQQFKLVTEMGIDRASAIAGVSAKTGIPADLLDQNIPF